MLNSKQNFMMIEEISIADKATFGKEHEKLNGLSKFNYLFGSNGSGKTTISRIIADETDYPTCKVTWKGGTKLHSMVYNPDFVERNFNQSSALKGVFTLGENQVDTLDKIKTAKIDLNEIIRNIERLTQTLQGADDTGGKRAELIRLEATLKEKCWTKKQKYDDKFKSAFEGYRGSSEKFKEKVILDEATNTAELVSLEELEEKAISIFGSDPTYEQAIPVADATDLLKHELNPILKKKVIGKDDIDISAMINKLGNSDWVSRGRPFYDANEGVCPFCQQSTDENFAKSLYDYFDEIFENDSKSIDDLARNYKSDADCLQQQVTSIIEAPSRFLDIEKLNVVQELLNNQILVNIQRLAEKKNEASRVVELNSIRNVTDTISSLIESANNRINEHNNKVENISTERSKLTAQVWRFVLQELEVDLRSYKVELGHLNIAIETLTGKINKTKNDKRNKEIEIRELEKQTTSVQPTIDGINAILSSFGFQSFSIAKEDNGTAYKLVRSDGSDAQTTLSEGEKTFVTFLYFYHLSKGSDSESGITNDRVVVFDDPVSSLDSEILFVVSSLIKGIFEEVRAGTGHIKQVFVLTHNVYFHKEVTFNPKRHKKALNEETFWIVRKPTNVTKVEKYPSNPIKTSYELLWSEVRSSGRSSLTIQNTLRRILENYFKILGGVDPDGITSKFEGKEKLICNSLFSWVNDGSHFAHDDLYVTTDSSTIASYLNVFRDIFDKTGQLAHYEMMMGNTLMESVNV